MLAMDETELHFGQQKEGDKELKINEKSFTTSRLKEWLEANYELKEGACIPRCLIYAHYLEYCRNLSTVPIGSAIFGKVIRTQFKTISTRRLGTRGQSKYHYYGLAMKESLRSTARSPTYTGLTRFTESNIHTKVKQQSNQGFTKKISMLDTFAKMKKRRSEDAHVSVAVQEKINGFLVVYEAHCQRLLDTVVAGNFDDVESSLLHFWGSMPSHVTKLLQDDAIHKVVADCDVILYKNINDVVIPRGVQEIPESFRSEISKFVKCFLPWLDICLMNAPKKLANVKMKVAKSYIKLLDRQIAFLSFAQPVKELLGDCQQTTRILHDLEKINFKEILGIKIKMSIMEESYADSLEKFFNSIVDLLRRRAQIDYFLSMMDHFIYDAMIEPCEKSNVDVKLGNNEFILNFSESLSKVMQDLTLKGARTFGSIYIITSMMMEYIFLVLESKAIKDREINICKGLEGISLEVEANREHPNNSKYQEAASTCSPQLEDKHVSLLQNQSTSRQLTARHEFEIAPSTQPRAAKENIIQSNCRIDSQYVSTVDYQSTCAVENQEAFDNSLTWMSSLPSFQDLVANNYWIDFQGNEISYPREQKVYMTVNPENSRFVGM